VHATQRPAVAPPKRPGAWRRAALHGFGRLWLVLDMRRRMEEGSASGVPWGGGLGKGGFGRVGGSRFLDSSVTLLTTHPFSHQCRIIAEQSNEIPRKSPCNPQVSLVGSKGMGLYHGFLTGAYGCVPMISFSKNGPQVVRADA
jgi:hypothetical protein